MKTVWSHAIRVTVKLLIELICLMDDDTEDDQESWYEIKERRAQNDSVKHLIPDEKDLYVFKEINPRGRLKIT